MEKRRNVSKSNYSRLLLCHAFSTLQVFSSNLGWVIEAGVAAGSRTCMFDLAFSAGRPQLPPRYQLIWLAWRSEKPMEIVDSANPSILPIGVLCVAHFHPLTDVCLSWVLSYVAHLVFSTVHSQGCWSLDGSAWPSQLLWGTVRTVRK